MRRYRTAEKKYDLRVAGESRIDILKHSSRDICTFEDHRVRSTMLQDFNDAIKEL